MSTTAVEVLLVEDDPADEELFARALQSRSLGGVAVARDGEAALQLLLSGASRDDGTAAANPRVVFLDLKLPKVGGIEVLRQLRGDPRTRSIPVVMLTSSCEDRDIADSYAAGANGYVVKPLDADEFARTIGDIAVYWMRINVPPT